MQAAAAVDDQEIWEINIVMSLSLKKTKQPNKLLIQNIKLNAFVIVIGN
jgi:hypothetical protein